MGHAVFARADSAMKCTEEGCDFSTTCARQMEAHKEDTHKEHYKPTLKCPFCLNWYSHNMDLERHVANDHCGERKFKCDREDCNYITNEKSKLSRHTKLCQLGKAQGNRLPKKVPLSNSKLIIKKESPFAVYDFGTMIGKGGFGEVSEAVKKGGDPSVKFAIKEVSKAGAQLALLEAARMARHNHKNLMPLIAFYQWKEAKQTLCCLVMELYRPGSLTTMQKDVRFDEVHVLFVMKEVACGLEYLHAQQIIHCDMKSANVLVNKRSEVKIADFGISTDSKMGSAATGTPGFAAPEQLGDSCKGVQTVYTQKADVWPIGVMGVDCLLPQHNLPTDFRQLDKVLAEAFAPTQLALVESKREIELSQQFKEVVSACLSTQTIRPTAKKVLEVPVIKNAPFEPFKELVALCLKNQEDRRNVTRGQTDASTTESTLFPQRKRKAVRSPSTGPSSASATTSTLFPTRKMKRREPSNTSDSSY